MIPAAKPLRCAGVRGPFTVTANVDGQLLCYHNERLIWQRALPARAQAISFINDIVLVALDDESVLALRLE